MAKEASEPGKSVDEIAERIVELLGKPSAIRRVRNSQILSGIVGIIGLALLLVGIEKIFVNLSGWTSVLIGLVLLAISGALLNKLR